MADGEGYPLGAVLGSINAGMSASAGLAAYRSAGGEVRTQTWYRLHGEAQAMLAGEVSEAAKPLNRLPTSDEITTWTTSTAAGFMQRVEVFVRDRATGEVTSKPWSTVGPGVVSRGAAVEAALGAYEDNAGDYDEQVLGAAYVGTHELVPGE